MMGECTAHKKAFVAGGGNKGPAVMLMAASASQLHTYTITIICILFQIKF